MRRIKQHYRAELLRCLGCVNGALKPAGGKLRNFAGMVYMRVGKQKKIYLTGQYGQVGIFIYIGSLFHTAIYHYGFTARLKQCAGACYFMRGSAKRNFHGTTSFLYIITPKSAFFNNICSYTINFTLL